MITVQERVQKGVEFLNEAAPEWWKVIDLGRLNLHSPCDCVLGQLFGDFGRALGDELDLSHTQSRILGFDIAFELEPDLKLTEYQQLTQAWKEAITQLRRGNQ